MSQSHRYPSPEEVVRRYPHRRKKLEHSRPLEIIDIPYSVGIALLKQKMAIQAIKAGKTADEIASILHSPEYEAKLAAQLFSTEMQGFLE